MGNLFKETYTEHPDPAVSRTWPIIIPSLHFLKACQQKETFSEHCLLSPETSTPPKVIGLAVLDGLQII